MQFKKCFGVKLLRIQSVSLLPHFPELSDTTLREGKMQQKEEQHERELDSLPLVSPKNQHRCICAYRSVDFGVLAVFLLKLLHSLLLLLPLLLVQALQVLPSLMLLQHLVAFELLVPLSVVVLQVLSGLDREPDRGFHLEILLELLIKTWSQIIRAGCLEQSVTGPPSCFDL